MQENEIILALVQDRETALAIFHEMPKCASYMRLNRGWAMYYWYEKYIGQVKTNVPHRYLRYLGDYVPLSSLSKSWSEFEKENGVFSTFDFRLEVAKCFPLEALGIEEAEKVYYRRPVGATHYNSISDKYHRIGEHEFSEYYVGGGHWMGSAYSNDDFSDLFIDLDKLGEEIKAL
jgi:hypothetical protein